MNAWDYRLREHLFPLKKGTSTKFIISKDCWRTIKDSQILKYLTILCLEIVIIFLAVDILEILPIVTPIPF